MLSCDKVWNFQVRNWPVSLKINIPQKKALLPQARSMSLMNARAQWVCGSEFLKVLFILKVLCPGKETKKETSLPGRPWVCQVWFMNVYSNCSMSNQFSPWQSTLLCRFAKFLIMNRTGFENWNASSCICEYAWKAIMEAAVSFLTFYFPSLETE